MVALRTTRLNPRRPLVWACLLLVIAGCGKGPTTAPVSGQITLAGRPIGPGRHEAAIKELDPISGPLRRGAAYPDSALYQVAVARMSLEQWAEAERVLERMIRDHPDTSLLDRVAWRMALCKKEAGDVAAAREWVGRFMRSFPKSALRSRVEKLLEAR